jgi:hypothetical protein
VRCGRPSRSGSDRSSKSPRNPLAYVTVAGSSNGAWNSALTVIGPAVGTAASATQRANVHLPWAMARG